VRFDNPTARASDRPGRWLASKHLLAKALVTSLLRVCFEAHRKGVATVDWSTSESVIPTDVPGLQALERALYHVPYEITHPDGTHYSKHCYYEVEEGDFPEGVLLVRSEEGHFSLADARCFPSPRASFQVLGRLLRVVQPRRRLPERGQSHRQNL
jgi:hypothetical protein